MENGVVLLTIPPHTSHKLQALDVAVFGPFQNFYNAAGDSWMVRHPGQCLSIYNIAELVGQVFEKAMTPSNIKAGFKKTGIFPFDRDVFTEDEFLSSEVTNRPLPKENLQLQPRDCVTPTVDDQQPSTSGAVLPVAENQIISPLGCWDYPRAKPRKNTHKRNKGKSLILTDTPVKTEIEERAQEREENKKKKTEKTKDIKRTKTEKVTKAIKFSSPPLTDSPAKDEKQHAQKREQINEKKTKQTENTINTKRANSEEVTKVVELSNPIVNLGDKGSSNESSDDEMALPVCTFKTPKAKDFVLVKFTQKQIKYFVGEILTDIDENKEYEINYMRRSAKIDNSFYFPLEPDMAMVSIQDIELVLPRPSLAGTTKRQSNMYSFPKKLLSKYKLG